MQGNIVLQGIEHIEELSGQMSISSDEKLMHSVMENDSNIIEKGKLLKNAVNNSMSTFTPDKMFEQMVKDFKTARNLIGDTIIRQLSDYDPDYIEKNIKIPEFQRELKKKLGENLEAMRDQGLLDDGNSITKKGYELAALVMFTEELDSITPKGFFGEHVSKRSEIYGDRMDTRPFIQGKDRYKDIAIKGSAKRAIRRGHTNLMMGDLAAFDRKKRGQNCIIYALDASGSMKGKKIELCKRAGIALAFKAMENKDLVGIVAFGPEIKDSVEPTMDFPLLIDRITTLRAARETDMAKGIEKALELFPQREMTKHLIIISDALPTKAGKGKDPEKQTLEFASIAKNSGITISFIGINLDEQGKKLAQQITEIGEGRLYVAKDGENLDKLILEDYYATL